MRQHGLHTAASRLEPVKAQKRVEPDQPGTGSVKAIDLESEITILVPVQPVGDQQHNSALPQDAPRPVTIESL